MKVIRNIGGLEPVEFSISFLVDIFCFLLLFSNSSTLSIPYLSFIFDFSSSQTAPDQWDPPFGIPTYTGPPPSLDSMTTTAEPSSSASISNQQVPVEDQADNEGEESEEDQEQDDEDEDEDEEISLPSGPAPPLPDLPSLPEEDPIGKDQDQDSDSDSDIVMPEGPPPPRKEEEDSDFQPPLPPIPTGAKSNHQSAPPPPPLPSGLPPSTNFNQPPPPIFYSGPPPPLPPSHLYSHPPPPLPLPNQFGHPPPPPGYGHPPNMRGNFNHRGGSFDGRGRGFDRGRGRGRGNFLPQDRRNPQFQQEVLDPLSADGKSHETFASHASKMREKSRSEATINQGKDSSSSSSGLNSLPSKPTSTPGAAGASKPSTASATISAEPQLRDLKKEVTAFLPPAMRRKLQKEKERKEMGLPDLNKLTSAPREEDQSGSGNGYGSNNNDGGSGYLEGWDDDDRQGNRNDTPSTNPKAREEFQTFEKPNLLNALKNQLNDPSKMGSRINVGSTGGNGSGKSNGEGNKKRKNDDYDKFLNEMGDLL